MSVDVETTPSVDSDGLRSDFDFSDVLVGSESVEGPLKQSRGTRDGAAPTGTKRRGRPRGSASAKKLEALQEHLSGEMFQAGTLTGLALPTTGYYICQESDGFTKAVVQLASKRPEWIAALENIAAVGPGLMVGRTVMGLGASITIDRSRNDPDRVKRLLNRPVVKLLGVAAAYHAAQSEEDMPEPGSRYEPPPAVFNPIT